ncbi:hypothetical protein JVU11DRAFT_11965 [Chiua virens]|nr:hypothetical protein JVU11DRAFT_11965 [Chiua virens]
MLHCPSCRKGGFKNQHAVTMHMSQPSSGCNTWVNNLIQLHDSLTLSSLASYTCSYTTSDSESSVAPMDVDQDFGDLNSFLDTTKFNTHKYIHG